MSACVYICRLDNLLTNFIAWRGILVKMLRSGSYNHQEPWKVAATLYKGTIYLQELETEEKRKREANMPPQQRATSYWGIMFEEYVTSKGTTNPLAQSRSVIPTKQFTPIFTCILDIRIRRCLTHAAVMQEFSPILYFVWLECGRECPCAEATYIHTPGEPCSQS